MRRIRKPIASTGIGENVMKITKRQLRRIIKEEKQKLQEGNFGGYDSIVEEVMQEISTYREELSAGGGDYDAHRREAVEAGREAIEVEIIIPHLTSMLPHVWDETIDEMARILYRDVSAEWLSQEGL